MVTYVQSAGLRHRLWFDGAVLLAVSVAAMSALGGFAENPVGVVCGLVFSLFASGHAVLRALFPDDLGAAERFALSVPVSFGVGALDGALLSLTPIGLSGEAMVLMLWVVTVACLTVGSFRWLGLTDQPAEATTRAPVAHLAIGTALLVVAGAWAAFSLVAASRVEPKSFTALSVDGANAAPGAGQPLTVTLDNEEGRPMQYDLEVNLAGTVLSRLDGLWVDPGKQYSFSVPPTAVGGVGADVLAYHTGDKQPYRRIHVGGAGQTP